jgi:hypothetical protein
MQDILHIKIMIKVTLRKNLTVFQLKSDLKKERKQRAG